MNTKALFQVIVLFLISIPGCGDSPEEIAEKYAVAMYSNDLRAAAEYITEDKRFSENEIIREEEIWQRDLDNLPWAKEIWSGVLDYSYFVRTEDRGKLVIVEWRVDMKGLLTSLMYIPNITEETIEKLSKDEIKIMNIHLEYYDDRWWITRITEVFEDMPSIE